MKNKISKFYFQNKVKILILFLSLICGLSFSWFLKEKITILIFNKEFIKRSIFVKTLIFIGYSAFFSLIFNIFGNYVQRNKLYNKNTKYFQIFIFSLFFSIFLFGENLKAGWWIIDDHEIIRFLGNDGKLYLREIPDILISHTEIGNIGATVRFRISYYILRLLEIAMWGNRPQLSYFFRILICTLFISTCILIVGDIIGFIGGIIFAMAVMSFNFWPDIFSRLGPSEAYVVLGVALFSLGLFFYFKNKNSKYQVIHWICILTGALISIGSKENMVLLAIPILFILIHSISTNNLSKPQLVTSIVIFIFCGIIVAIILHNTSISGGRDIYSSDISLKSVLVVIKNEIVGLPKSLTKYFLITNRIGSLLFIVIILGLLLFSIFNQKISKSLKNNVRTEFLKCAGLIICVYFFLISQRVFYISGWPKGMRYDFPGRLGEMIVLAILAFTCLKIFEELKIAHVFRDILKLFSICIFLLAILENNFYSNIRASAKYNAYRSLRFTDQLLQIQEEASIHPDYPIILQSFNVGDYEPIISTLYFLRANKISNPLMLKLNGYSTQIFPKDSLHYLLATGLEEISMNGGEPKSVSSFNQHETGVVRRGREDFSPLNYEYLNGECYCIDFSGESDSDCIKMVRIW